jgi:uncharacterized protein (DUF927 family)
LLPIVLWDFQHTKELIEQGYQITQKAIIAWDEERKPFGRDWLDRLR